MRCNKIVLKHRLKADNSDSMQFVADPVINEKDGIKRGGLNVLLHNV